MKNVDLWLVNGVWSILLGLMGMVFNFGRFNTTALLVTSVVPSLINVAIGYALIKHSKVVFWIIFIITVLGSISELQAMFTSPIVNPTGLITLVLLGLLAVKVLKEKEVVKTKSK